MRIGRLSNLLAPGYGSCGRCMTNWAFVKGHSTPFEDCKGNVIAIGNELVVFCGRACFPLCNQCWKDLQPKDRLPYYELLWESWRSEALKHDFPAESLEAWESLRANVLAGP